MQDMLCTGYEGGNDCTMFRNVEDLHLNPKNSMFVCIAPYQQEEYANPLDITGKDRTHGIGGLHDEKQYATADYYSAYWGESEWSHDSRPADKDYAFDMESHQRNTECFQGHQSMYNPNSNQKWERVHPFKGGLSGGRGAQLYLYNPCRSCRVRRSRRRVEALRVCLSCSEWLLEGRSKPTRKLWRCALEKRAARSDAGGLKRKK